MSGAATSRVAGDGFCLALAAGRSSVGLGEPAVVAVSLRNCSQEAKQIEDVLALEYGFLHVSLSRPDGGKPVPLRPAAARDARGKRPRSLLPGASLETWVRLFADAEGWTLGRPGRYDVHAEYQAEGVHVSATPVSLIVVAPMAPEEQTAADLLMDKATAMMLLTGRDEGERGSKRLLELLREHPRSLLAPYAQLALGMERTREPFEPALKAFRKADCKGAVELLGPALRRVPDPFLAALCARSLAQCLRALGRQAEAQSVVEEYSRSHPGGRELPGVSRVLEDEDRS